MEFPPEWLLFCRGNEHGIGGGEFLKEDNAVIQMLDFLEADILHRPEQLQSLNWESIARITTLVGDVDVDLNAPLVFDDE